MELDFFFHCLRSLVSGHPTFALSLIYTKQDWPVAGELVPGGMYFPFCLHRARYDNPIRQMSHGTIGKKNLGPYRTGTCFVYFTFEICHQLKCCSAIGLVGVLVKFLRTSLLQRFRMLNLSCLGAGHLGKQVGGTKEAVTSYLIKLSERLPCVSDLTDDPCGRY